MKFSVIELVELDAKRILPVALEQLWEKRTGINPVAQAIEYVSAYKSRSKTRLVFGFVWMLAAALSAAGTLTFQTFYLEIEGTPWLPTLGTTCLGLGVVSTTFFLFHVLSFSRFSLERLPNRNEAERYAAALGAFVSWSQHDLAELSRYDFGLNSLRKEAERILVDQARGVLSVEGEEHDPVFQEEKIELTKKMYEKYDALMFLTLARGDGVGWYFTRAKKKIKAESSTRTKAA